MMTMISLQKHLKIFLKKRSKLSIIKLKKTNNIKNQNYYCSLNKVYSILNIKSLYTVCKLEII